MAVDFMGDSLKMVYLDAVSFTTEMVQFEAIWDWPNKALISPAVCELASASTVELAIAIQGVAASPG